MLETLDIDEAINNLMARNYVMFSHLNNTTIQGKVQAMSTFADINDFELPLQITGRLITAGTYDDNQFGEIEIPASELKKAAPKWEGVEIFSHHGVFRAINQSQDVDIGNVVGKITKTEFNEREGAIDFVGEISDEDIARKILHGLIKFISVGFGRDPEKKDDGAVLKNISPKESSLVFEPRDSAAEFVPKI